MIHPTQISSPWRPMVAVAVLVLVAASCSGGDAGPESGRACEVVTASELSDIIGTDVELEDAEDESSLCTFTNGEEDARVDLTVDAPVEAGLPELLLTEPTELADLGDEAWTATRNVPGDIRLMVRSGGALLTADVSVVGATRSTLESMVAEIGEAGVERLPEAEVTEAGGPRGDEACDRYTSEEVAAVLGGVPTVTPSTPPGSSALVVESLGLTVNVSVLVESGATETELGGIVAAVDRAELVDLDGMPAFWLPSVQGIGGQLNVLIDDRLLQIAIIGDLDTEESLAIAEALASVASR